MSSTSVYFSLPRHRTTCQTQRGIMLTEGHHADMLLHDCHISTSIRHSRSSSSVSDRQGTPLTQVSIARERTPPPPRTPPSPWGLMPLPISRPRSPSQLSHGQSTPTARSSIASVGDDATLASAKDAASKTMEQMQRVSSALFVAGGVASAAAQIGSIVGGAVIQNCIGVVSQIWESVVVGL